MATLVPSLQGIGKSLGMLSPGGGGAGAAHAAGAAAGGGGGGSDRPEVAKGRCTVAISGSTSVIRLTRPASAGAVLEAVERKVGKVSSLTYKYEIGGADLAFVDSDNAEDLDELFAKGETVAMSAVPE